jgi:hypothetical protein
MNLIHHSEILSLKGCSYVKHGIIDGAETAVVAGCGVGVASTDFGLVG